MDSPASMRRLYLAGSIASFGYVAAQAIQWAILSAMSDPSGAAAALEARLATLDLIRASLLWLSFWALPVAFYALFRRLIELRPHRARLGLAASLLFVACELSYRTVDLFVVTRSWAVRWAAATGPARTDLAERVALWDEIVEGWYVMLLAAHAVGLAAFAAAVGWRGGRLDRTACLALASYALATALRLVSYAVAALEPVCAALYFPTAMASFVAIGALLLCRRDEAGGAGAAARRDRIRRPGSDRRRGSGTDR